MNLNFKVIGLLLGLGMSIHGNETAISVEDSSVNVQFVPWSVLKTFAAGTLIGSAAGASAFSTDTCGCFPINWLIFCQLRDFVCKVTAQYAQENGRQVNVDSLEAYAQCADWITYLSLQFSDNL